MTTKFVFNPISGQFDEVTATINLATDVTGVLPEIHGGTAQSTYTTGDTLYASASNVVSKLTIGSTGDVLTVAGGIPIWAPTSAGSTNFAVYQYSGFNGYGSTDTFTAKFSNSLVSNDTSNLLTVVNSSVTAMTITANRRCDITIVFCWNSTNANDFGLTKNSSSGSTAITSLADAEIVAFSVTPGTTNTDDTVVRDIAVTNDVYRPQTGGGVAGANANLARIYITAREF